MNLEAWQGESFLGLLQGSIYFLEAVLTNADSVHAKVEKTLVEKKKVVVFLPALLGVILV